MWRHEKEKQKNIAWQDEVLQQIIARLSLLSTEQREEAKRGMAPLLQSL